MAFNLIGKNFTPPDVRAKVTGKSMYAEDIRAEGMAFCKLLTSPYPHAKVTNIDASEAMKMEGVYGVLTADDVPNFPAPQESILTMEPTFVGDPILAVAAVDETTAENAIEKIKVTYEALPFVVDPLQSLQPGGPNAHEGGNVVTSGSGEGMGGVPQLKTVKWAAKDFAMAQDGQLPEGEPLVEWKFGDVDAGMKAAKYVLDESFVTASNPHHSMEPRSSFAYWENGKCTLYGSTQSQSFVMPGLAKLLGVSPDQVNYISEYCGGGFGSKGSAYAVMTVSAHMAKKINRPCLLRISRSEEYYLGSARAGFQGRLKLGFAANGRLLAADVYIVHQNGSKQGFFDYQAAGDAVSLVYQPENMRFRAIPISTNTPPNGPQRGPGQNQIAVAMEPLMDKAAKALGIDRLKIRELNAPNINSKVDGRQKVSSAYVKEALDMTAARFNYADKIKMSGQKKGSKVIGVGVGQAYHSAGGAGFDGHRAHHAGRQAPYPYRRRQSRHLFLRHDVARRGGSAGLRLGRLHHRAWRQPQGPAVEPRPVRLEHLLHHVAHQLRRGDGCQAEAAGNRGHGSRRQARGLRRRRHEGLLEGRQVEEPGLRRRGQARRRTRRQVRRP